MNFYNRERELKGLAGIAELAADSAHMLVVTGRRRIGKTELARSLLLRKTIRSSCPSVLKGEEF